MTTRRWTDTASREVPGLANLRRRRFLTQRELAEDAGVSRETIYKLERGGRKARPRTVRRLAETLRALPQELTDADEE